MKKIYLKTKSVNEGELPTIQLNDPVSISKINDINVKIMQMQKQQTDLQKQINDLLTQKTQISNNAAKTLSNTTQQPQNNITPDPQSPAGIAATSALESFNEEFEKFKHDFNIKWVTAKDENDEVISTSDVNDTIYVSFNDGGNNVLGKIYKKTDTSNWSTSCIKNDCDTFQEMSFVGKLGHYGVLDKLENFYDDVKEISEDEYNTLIAESKENELFDYIFENTKDKDLDLLDDTEDISDISFML